MTAPVIDTTYPYRDEEGEVLFEVVRYRPKDFRQRRRGSNGLWSWNLGDVRRVPYRLHELAKHPGRQLFVVEGEKDAEGLAELGLLVTTLPGGAGAKWLPEYAEHFNMRPVVLIPDNDEPGRLLMHRIAAGIARHATHIRWLELPGLPAKGDVSDFLAQTNADVKIFLEAVYQSARGYKPAAVAHSDLIHLNRIEATTVEWLWKPWLPAGKLCLIDGDPGQGKSFLTLDLAARLSRGDVFPDGATGLGQPVTTLLISCEDGLRDTVLPRLAAMNADLGHVVGYQGRLRDGKIVRLPELPEDLPYLEQVIRESQAKLVVIDPLMAFLSGSVNSISDQSVRQVLTPLSSLAEQLGVTILFVRHLNKTNGKQAVYRGGGSIGIIAAMRTAMLVARHPHDRDLRVLAMVKCNLAAEPQSLGFRLATDDQRPDITRVTWAGAVDLHANELVGDVKEALNPKDWLKEALAGGPRLATELLSEAAELSISRRTLQRAKLALNVTSLQRTAADGPHWYWLPPGMTDWPASQAPDSHLLEPLPDLDPMPPPAAPTTKRQRSSGDGPYTEGF